MPCARRIAPRRRARCAVVAAIFPVIAAPAVASAQERIRFEELPDEALYAITLQRESEGDRDPVRANGYAGIAGSIWRGADGARSAGPFAGLGVGAWSSPTTYLQFRTEAVLPVRDDQRIPVSPSWRDVEGAHRVRAQLGIGDLT